MSVKKQIPSLCWLYSFNEGITVEFLDETDVDSYFYCNLSEICQSQHRIARASKSTNKRSFAMKLLSCSDFASWRHSSVRFSKKCIFPKENSLYWLTVCAIFSKLLMKWARVYRFHYRNRKLRLDLQIEKTIFLLITVKMSLNIQIDNVVYRSDSKTIFPSFPSKSLNYPAINLYSQKLSTLTVANFTTSTRTDKTLQIILKCLRAITMCSTFTRDFRYVISIFKFIGFVYRLTEMCSGKLYVHKKTFQSLRRDH